MSLSGISVWLFGMNRHENKLFKKPKFRFHKRKPKLPEVVGMNIPVYAEGKERTATPASRNGRKSGPGITVILPIYGSEEEVRQCLDSLMSQTLPYLEIIIFTDATAEYSESIYREYALRDRRIRWLQQNHRNLTDMSNTGVRLATGKYIFFMDCNDLLASSEQLLSMYQEAQRNSYDILLKQEVSQSVPKNADPQNGDEMQRNGKALLISLISRNKLPATMNGILFARELFDNHNLSFQNSFMYQEEALFVKILYYSERIGFYPGSCFREADQDSFPKKDRKKRKNRKREEINEVNNFKKILSKVQLANAQYEFFQNTVDFTSEERKRLFHYASQHFLKAVLFQNKIKHPRYRIYIKREIKKHQDLLLSNNENGFPVMGFLIRILGAGRMIKLLAFVGQLLRFK